jgi:hypothetical protein
MPGFVNIMNYIVNFDFWPMISLLFELFKVAIVPLASAFFGAYAAQAIARMDADTKRDLEEARATNLAISATAALVESIANLKHQHVQPMVERFRHAKESIAKPAGEAIGEVELDFKTLLGPFTPLPMLEKLIYERVSPPPPCVGLFVHLDQSVKNLSQVIEARNNFISEVKSDPSHSTETRSDLYFGFRNNEGIVDERYPDLIAALKLFTDDCILFGSLLAAQLVDHAHVLNPRGERKGFPKPSVADFGVIEEKGLIPPIGEAERHLLEALGVRSRAPLD